MILYLRWEIYYNN